MEKEERSVKLQRLSELFCRNECFRNLAQWEGGGEKRFPPYYDFIHIWEKEGNEYWKLHHELYPEPPKDLFEDVKKRTEAYKKVKDGTFAWFRALSFREKIKVLFGIKISHEKTK